MHPVRPPEAPAEAAGLLARIALRDAAALSSLYDLAASAVYGVCRRILRDKSDAEEAAGDVFLQVWHDGAQFDARQLRRRLTWLPRWTVDALVRPTTLARGSSRSARLGGYASASTGLTDSEIAERLSQPLGTAKSRIRLALAHLRRTLEPGVEGGIA